MKYLSLLLLTLFTYSISAQAIKVSNDKEVGNPLYIVSLNGENVNFYNSDMLLNTIDPDQIKSINVLKPGSADYDLYGQNSEDGVIIITLKSGDISNKIFKQIKEKAIVRIDANQNTSTSLRLGDKVNAKILFEIQIDGESFVLDNEEFEMKKIEPNDIKNITVHKDNKTLKAYDAADKDGLIIISLKKNKTTKALKKELQQHKKKN